MNPQGEWWQISFFATAGLLVGWEIFRGWKAGATRQLLNLTTLAVAYAAAVWAGSWGSRLNSRLSLFGSLTASVVVGTVVFILASMAVRRVLRQEAPATPALISRKKRALGAFVGALIGLFFVCVAAVGVRLVGTVAENVLVQNPAERETAASEIAGENVFGMERGGLITGLSGLKNTLEHGAVGAVLQRVDPMPAQTYSILAKVTQVIADPKLVQRFTAYPGAKALMEHPKMIALRDDPDIQRTVLSRNYLALMANESVTSAVNDPELANLVRNFELEKALDFALGVRQAN